METNNGTPQSEALKAEMQRLSSLSPQQLASLAEEEARKHEALGTPQGTMLAKAIREAAAQKPAASVAAVPQLPRDPSKRVELFQRVRNGAPPAAARPAAQGQWVDPAYFSQVRQTLTQLQASHAELVHLHQSTAAELSDVKQALNTVYNTHGGQLDAIQAQLEEVKKMWK